MSAVIDELIRPQLEKYNREQLENGCQCTTEKRPQIASRVSYDFFLFLMNKFVSNLFFSAQCMPKTKKILEIKYKEKAKTREQIMLELIQKEKE